MAYLLSVRVQTLYCIVSHAASIEDSVEPMDRWGVRMKLILTNVTEEDREKIKNII
jgi:hypothetical protein